MEWSSWTYLICRFLIIIQILNPTHFPKLWGSTTFFFFFLGNRKYSKYHARIRKECSNLNSDFFNNHISQNPGCTCGHLLEDDDHYLFNCTRYTEPRLKLFRQLHRFHPLNINLLMFGSANLSFEDNVTIFTSAHNFIKESGRFDWCCETRPAPGANAHFLNQVVNCPIPHPWPSARLSY